MLSQQDYLPILVESFLIDRKAQGLAPDTIQLYTKKLKYFLRYCERQALTQISQITSDFIRRYLFELSETHNPGGIHVCFRAVGGGAVIPTEAGDGVKEATRQFVKVCIAQANLTLFKLTHLHHLFSLGLTNHQRDGKGNWFPRARKTVAVI